MSIIGKSLVIKGEVRAQEDLTLECDIDGPVLCENFTVVVSAGAHVKGTVVARDVTVFGRSTGQLVATEVVEIRPDATVTGSVVTPRFILHDGASFNGRSDPSQV